MKRSLPPAAIAIILSDDKSEVLLVKRRDVPVWVLPGGGINPSEKPEEAAIREAWEETHLHIKIDRQSGHYSPINRLSAITSVFVCHVSSGNYALSNETSGCAFFPIDDLPSSLFVVHKDWLNDAMQSNQLVQKPIDQVTYWRLFLYLLSHPYLVVRYSLTRLMNFFRGE